MSSRFLFPALLLLPLAEIAAFVLVGQKIGVAATILMVLASSFAGLTLLRQQGVNMLRNIQTAPAAGDDGSKVMKGMLHMVAGLLLAVPGFITSAIGLLLLLPFTRTFLWRLLKPEVIVSRSAQFYRRSEPQRPSSPQSSGVIDLDAEDFHREKGEDGKGLNNGPDKGQDRGRSPWAGPEA